MEEGFESGWRKMNSNGWSARGGTCVSAYNPQRNPLGESFYPSYFWSLTQWAKDPTHGSHSGSSTGSAVAVSAGFAPAALGTETLGSLCAPADAAVRLREMTKTKCYRLT
jgi:amidase